MAALESCGTFPLPSSARFTVVNETLVKVDSIVIEPDEKQGYTALESGDSMTYISEMEKQPRVDGSYHLTYRVGKEKKGLTFGYFSNGIPSERGTRVVLRPDTVLIGHIF